MSDDPNPFKDRLVKVTNTDENHHGFQYHDGLNELQEPFDPASGCGPGGLYFIDVKDLKHYLSYGVWIREVELPSDAQWSSVYDKYKADKLVLNHRWDICSPETIKHFTPYLPVTDVLKHACATGRIDFLDWWFKNEEHTYDHCWPGDIGPTPLDSAVTHKQTEVIQWWINSGLPLKYSSCNKVKYCQTCINLSKDRSALSKWTSDQPVVSVNWVDTYDAHYNDNFWRKARRYDELCLHGFPDDLEYQKAEHYRNPSLCLRAGIEPDIIHAIRYSIRAPPTLLFRRDPSVRVTLPQIMTMLCEYFNRDDYKIGPVFFGGSVVLSRIAPDLDIVPDDIDIFCPEYSNARFRHISHRLSVKFGSRKVEELYNGRHTRIHLDPDVFSVKYLDLVRIDDAKTFYDRCDLTITRPTMDTKMEIKSHPEDLEDIKNRNIGVRLKQSSSDYARTERRIKKYLDRGFKTVGHLELVDHGCIKEYK